MLKFTNELNKLWSKAAFAVKQAQENFCAAYKATLDHCFPNWENTWKNDADTFEPKVLALEDQLKAHWLELALDRSSWTRYLAGARRMFFAKLPFRLALRRISIKQAKIIAAAPNEAEGLKKLQAMQKEKGLKAATNKVAKGATVIPYPDQWIDKNSYVDDVLGKLAQHFHVMAETLGPKAVGQLLYKLNQKARRKGKARPPSRPSVPCAVSAWAG